MSRLARVLALSVLLGSHLAAGRGQMTTVTKAPSAPQSIQGATIEELVEAEPDVVLRGRTMKIIVKGPDLDTLKTLQVRPATGIRIGAVAPLPAPADGSAAVSVELHVDGSADTGERTLMLTIAPKLSVSSGARPGGASLSPEVAKVFEAATKGRTTLVEAGRLYVNSHDITISKVDVAAREPFAVRIAVTDAAGDFRSSGPRSAAPQTAGILVLGPSSDLVISEARCGADIFDSVLDEAVVAERHGASTVITATLDGLTLQGAGACDLRLRVRDAGGNMSGWFKTSITVR